MKKILSLFLSILLGASCLAGCGEQSKTDSADNAKLTYYDIKNVGLNYDSYSVTSYNKQCENDEDIIEIVEFESEEALKNKLSTELMSGGGPDLISYAQLSMLGISYEKLIAQGCFADLDEIIKSDTSGDTIDLSQYNQAALEAGVFDGKRYCIPQFYIPEFYVASKQELSKYADIKTKSLSYDDAISIDSKLKQENSGKCLTSGTGSFLYSYVYDNIDFYNKTFNFDVNFGSTAEKLKSIKGNDENGADVLFETYFNSPYDYYSKFAEIESGGENPALVGAVSTNADEYSAQIYGAYFVNKNSDKYDKIIKFLKFALSEEEQNEVVGAEIEKFDPNYSSTIGLYFPVNIKSYETLMKNAASVRYLDDTVNISDENVSLLENSISQITNYSLPSSTNYMAEVGGELIEDYIDGDITTSKFVNSLKSKTKIYLEE